MLVVLLGSTDWDEVVRVGIGVFVFIDWFGVISVDGEGFGVSYAYARGKLRIAWQHNSTDEVMIGLEGIILSNDGVVEFNFTFHNDVVPKDRFLNNGARGNSTVPPNDTVDNHGPIADDGLGSNDGILGLCRFFNLDVLLLKHSRSLSESLATLEIERRIKRWGKTLCHIDAMSICNSRKYLTLQ